MAEGGYDERDPLSDNQEDNAQFQLFVMLLLVTCGNTGFTQESARSRHAKFGQKWSIRSACGNVRGACLLHS